MTYLDAARKHMMWFGSYTRKGELKKVQVWCFVRDGQLEFLTPDSSLKVKRVGRNAQVICFLGSSDGPRVEGTAEILREPQALAYGLRAYWKAHPLQMLIVSWFIKGRIKRGEHVLIRVVPREPNPLAGVTEPKL